MRCHALIGAIARGQWSRSIHHGLGGQRICLDKPDPNVIHDEIEPAVTRPRTGDKGNLRNRDQAANWPEYDHTENNGQKFVGKERYFLSGDSYLMPARKDQPPPDLRYFMQTRR